ncbi:MAG: 3-phosphoshikimate 1-carboxyvinyltransferase [Clostridia bacterium]|nr:3-phosphoshikimate 1-carboxyvinyltransferase [Clostridia bacterium]
MNVRMQPSAPCGTLRAIPSKSAAHRLLICAAFADGETTVRCDQINEDIVATVRCLCALGATIVRDAPYYRVTPIKELQKNAVLDCGESGSTMRFLVPLTCMLGADASFVMAGRLPNRPLSPLREELERCGIRFSPAGSNPMVCLGQIEESDFSIAGNVSSQFISGLLFALAVSGKVGTLTVEGTLESAPYVDMTADALRRFGILAERVESGYVIRENNGLRSPREVFVEGDWSGAAFPLCMGAIGSHPITVEGLDLSSRQGDRAVVSILRQFGAKVTAENDRVTVSPAPLCGIEIDASQIPDLVPVLATVASVAKGKTVIDNASRLRLKESDRLQTVRAVLNALGAKVTETPDGLIIEGVDKLSGGAVSSFGDHRIAMSAAVASVACRNAIVIEQAESAAKSYPAFWEDMDRIGASVETDAL